MLKTKDEADDNSLDFLFDSRDFEFVNTFYSDLTILRYRLSIERQVRSLIISLLDHLNFLIASNTFDVENDKQEVETLLYDIEAVSYFINKNIDLYMFLEENILKLHGRITSLLLEMKAGKNDEDSFKQTVEQLKENLNANSLELNSIKLDILANEFKISIFFNKDITLKYLKTFHLNLIHCENTNDPEVVKRLLQDGVLSSEQTDKTKETTFENSTLIVSEKENRVYLPYTTSELKDYIEQYPEKYADLEDVIASEFILSLDYFQKRPLMARYRETYSLIRDKEMKSVLESFRYAFKLMFRYDLNPTIVAACKTQEQLEKYIDCLDRQQTNNFDEFQIRFEISPI